MSVGLTVSSRSAFEDFSSYKARVSESSPKSLKAYPERQTRSLIKEWRKNPLPFMEQRRYELLSCFVSDELLVGRVQKQRPSRLSAAVNKCRFEYSRLGDLTALRFEPFPPFFIEIQRDFAEKLSEMERIGSGTYGDVYSYGRYVFKVLKNEDGYVCLDLVHLEEHFLRLLRNPYVVRYVCSFSFADLDGRAKRVLVLERMRGSLFKFIRDKQTFGNTNFFSVEQIMVIASQMLRFFEYAHEEGVVYKDCKPENILIGPDGQIRVSDFGLSMRVDDDRIVAGQKWLSTSWYSPPNPRRELDQSSYDIWSLGCILLELYLGHPAFPSEERQDHTRFVYESLDGEKSDHLYNRHEEEMRRRIHQIKQLKGDQAFDEAAFIRRSDLLYKLIFHKLLVWNPTRRVTAKDALSDELFSTVTKVRIVFRKRFSEERLIIVTVSKGIFRWGYNLSISPEDLKVVPAKKRDKEEKQVAYFWGTGREYCFPRGAFSLNYRDDREIVCHQIDTRSYTIVL